MYYITLIRYKSTFWNQLTTLQQQFNATEQCNSKGNGVMRKNIEFFQSLVMKESL